MIKGIQKQMVMVRLQESAAFETAYFVLRDGFEKESTDIVAEANSLARQAFSKTKVKADKSRTHTVWHALLFFLSGLTLGTLITSLFCLVIL